MIGPSLPRLVLVSALGLAALVGCTSMTVAPDEPDVVAQAAAEATVLVQQAQATALMLRAQATATAMIGAVGAATATRAMPTATPIPASTVGTVYPTPTVAVLATTSATGAPSKVVEVTSVSLAAEGGMIMVRFRAPPKEAEKWWQGSVSVTDEATEAIYNEIPVMPRIGPLIGRPKREGQLGYVMLINAPPWLRAGAVVTVVLGNHTFEHIQVQ